MNKHVEQLPSEELVATINFDGGIRPHPEGGYAYCYGWIIRCGNIKITGHDSERLPSNDGSCLAEFNALIRAMCNAYEANLPAIKFLIIGDSQSVIDTCAHDGSIKSKIIVRDMMDVDLLAEMLGEVTFKWVPRSENYEADALCSAAFDELTHKLRRVELMNTISSMACHKCTKATFHPKMIGDWTLKEIGKARLSKASLGELKYLFSELMDATSFPIQSTA